MLRRQSKSHPTWADVKAKLASSERLVGDDMDFVFAKYTKRKD